MASKPVKKGTNQQEKKAKGLLANVGDYKKKSLNLTKKQLGKSGQAAASARKIAISRTQYDPQTKKVLGPMGKPITGRVDMGGGNIAVYKDGVRVTAKKPGSGRKDRPSNGVSAAAKAAGAGKRYEEKKASMRPGQRPGAGPSGSRSAVSGTVTSGMQSAKDQSRRATSGTVAAAAQTRAPLAGQGMAGRAGAAGKARTVAQLERQLNLVKQAANARKSRAAQTAADRAAAQREQQRIKELQAAIERAKRS
jgi:hypothetical protein